MAAPSIFSAAKRQVVERLKQTAIQPSPFPHVYVEDIFPAEFYAAIQHHRLPDEAYRRLSDTGRVSGDAYKTQLCLMHDDVSAAADAGRAFWRDFFATFDDRAFAAVWLELFGPIIRERLLDDFPDIGDGMRMRGEFLLMRDLPTYALGPHTNSPSKIVSVLFYLPADDSHAELGTSLYLPRDPGFVCRGGPHHPFAGFNRVDTMPYRPNTLFAFPKTKRSFHGVEPLPSNPYRRDLLLYDIRSDVGA